MSSLTKFSWHKKPKKQKLQRAKYLESCPQKKGSCKKVYTTKPKKHNYAILKVAKVTLSTNKSVIIAIPGHGHSLQEHSIVLIRGGRIKDVPGVHYKAIRGKYDFSPHEFIDRFNRRSKFGIRKVI
jgi:small subunit ribosomal protein S12